MIHSRFHLGAKLGAGVLLLAVALPAGADYNAGVEAYKAREYTKAVQEFQKVVEQSPDHAGSHYMLGVSLRGAKQTSRALASLRKAAELDPSNASYAIALGQTLIQANQHNDAYLTLKKVRYADLDTRARQSYAPAFANAAIKAGFPGEAISVLEAQVKATPKNADMFYTLGYAYSKEENYPKAFTAFKKAYDLKPSDTKSGSSAAKTAISAGRRATGSQKDSYYSQGAIIAEKLASSSPTFDNFLLAGEARLGAKDYRKALGWFDRARSKQAQNALVHFYHSQCNTNLGQYSAAITDLQQVLKIGVSGKMRTQVYNQMGFVYDKTKQYDKAVTAYKNAGNSKMVKSVEDKKEKAAQNVAAAAEQAAYQRKLLALEQQIQALEAIGEIEEAKDLREHLEKLREQ
ncbi:MAG: tetratricopeptide repeat protein [Acidobacteria bacterium]|nr:tetratricopeptide repeat protein [Acidobacteriota bacterium]